MQGGFSFCGVDIAKFGLEYVPSLDQTYVFAGSNYEVHQETVDAHDGGYFYGTTMQPKDFSLRCYFQNQSINSGVLDTIESFFYRGRTGKLVFQHRDWMWYTATVVRIDTSNIVNRYNGFVTIDLRAYYPYARHDYIGIDQDVNMLSTYIARNSGLLLNKHTPITEFDNVSEDQSILLYNGGTEKAGVAIALSGDAGDGVTITNNTTGQTAKFIAFTSEKTNNGKMVISDAINGKTILSDGSTSERAFMYHDYGFIDLAPSYPIFRDLYVSYEANSPIVLVSSTPLGDDVIGKYIHINDVWHKIVDYDDKDGKMTIDAAIEKAGAEHTDVVRMNEIDIKLGAGANLAKLKFIYKPTFH